MEDAIRAEAMRILEGLADNRDDSNAVQRAMIEMDILMFEALKTLTDRVETLESYLRIPELQQPDNGAQNRLH